MLIKRKDTSNGVYLPGGGFSSEELMIERAVRGNKLGLEEDTAIGYGLQRGGTFVGEAKPNEKLEGREEISSLYNNMLISRSALL